MNTNDTNTSNSSKLALFPGTKMVIFDADTYDSICILLEDMKTYIRKTGARVKYTQPERFAKVWQEYINRIEKELEKGKQFNENIADLRDENKRLKDIINASTIDAEPVKHGEWENVKFSEGVYKEDDDSNDIVLSITSAKCSLCQRYSDILQQYSPKMPAYCSHCGAKMD